MTTSSDGFAAVSLVGSGLGDRLTRLSVMNYATEDSDLRAEPSPSTLTVAAADPYQTDVGRLRADEFLPRRVRS